MNYLWIVLRQQENEVLGPRVSLSPRVRNRRRGTREMAQWLRPLAVLPEDPGSVPSIYMTVHNCLKLQLPGIVAFFWPL